MSKFFKFVHSRSLFFIVSAIVIVSIILVSISTSIITIKLSKNVLVDTFSKSNYKALSQVTDNLLELNYKIINIMNVIDNNPDFKNYMTKYNMTPQYTYKTLYNLNKNLNDSISEKDFNNITVAVVGLNHQIYIQNGDHLLLSADELLNDDITKTALNNKNIVLYQYLKSGVTSQTENSSSIAAIKVLCDKLTRQPYGFVYVFISQEAFQKYFLPFAGNANTITILSSDSKVVSSNISSKIGSVDSNLNDISNDIIENNLSSLNTAIDSNDVTVLSKHLPFFNFNIVDIINKDIVLNEMYNTLEIILVNIFIGFIFILITFFIIKKITKPISTLASTMPKVINGNFNNHIALSGSIEIEQLSSAFNIMLDGLNNYINKEIKMQKEKRKAEIHALQMQINPHFIYNTLSSIKWLVWQEEKEKSIETIDAFISLLRNTISNKNEMITITEEIDNLKNYVLINHIRYGDNITVNFFIMPGCEDYIIPKLILQPFIENAFFHGFSNKENGTIHVFINKQNDDLICEIIDNGIGISRDNVKNILSSTDKKHEHFSGIGINNVNDRIKLIYGDNYGVTITSQLNTGTTVKVVIPAQKELKSI